ncbi:MAG: DnaD domain protein [Anaerolineae bacterium]|nr:DnaD domain protein [Anaerolineae bacterium]
MKGFSGFPDKFDLERVPAPFFSELLPIIDHLGEMKVTLYCFWALARKAGEYRYLTHADFAHDPVFMSGLGPHAGPVLDDALERAVARGTLLHVRIEEDTAGAQDLYFLNSGRGRAAVDAIRGGLWRPTEDVRAPVELTLNVTRPNIFVVYEQNIGPLTPLIADQLREIEAQYPQAWIEEAIGLAAANNARSLAYFRAILKRWQTEGKDRGKHQGDTQEDRRRYFEGEYADDIKR